LISTAKRLDYIEYINSVEWKAVRQRAFQHYGKKCTKCGSETLLHVHHNTYKNFKNEQMKDLNVLCEVCHMALHDRIKKVTIVRLNKKLKSIDKKTNKKPKKSKNRKQNDNQKPKINKPKTMLEVIESIKQHNANKALKQREKEKRKREEQLKKPKEIKQPKPAKHSKNPKKEQIHAGIDTPNQRGYKETQSEAVQVLEKEKPKKHKKPKKSKISNEYVKVKTWLDIIQEEMDLRGKTYK